MAKERRKAKEREAVRVEAPAPEIPVAEVEVKSADASPGFVRVRNEGSRAWIGGDYPPGKVSSIAPGEVAELTEQRAAELVSDYREGAGGIGPFVVVGA